MYINILKSENLNNDIKHHIYKQLFVLTAYKSIHLAISYQNPVLLLKYGK
ncbi:hypothetical protein CHU_0690 [Cytophaga hutchinsonii ATCC 33406]|uniref:Uncharacterized protein n=1 Tax=Cytophaga hutchinsonii (strain ATCC 33406 / DSM 1761 / CIP 103989 / NBRC 15051 / NCIMB 9469 / D465) TaxID=269798 RepID=A0A6N4SNX4_CYTH3|nr:hypothetical protein CHU_0690 [Cytophaga hutchinsonii ATCC 33406]